jgi:hypothetical protein
MLAGIRSSRRLQLALFLFLGFCFGFLLQKGGLTSYDLIESQLLLQDFSVLTIFLTAVLTGAVLSFFFRRAGLATLHVQRPSLGQHLLGGLIFGVGFGIMGYCPGSATAAVGQGSLDALAGVIGILTGVGVFAGTYPYIRQTLLSRGKFRVSTLPMLLNLPEWLSVAGLAALITASLGALQLLGV